MSAPQLSVGKTFRGLLMKGALELRTHMDVRPRIHRSWIGFQLGAFLACAVLLPSAAHAGDLVPPKVLVTTPTGVNIATTTFSFTNTDLSIGTISVDRFYSATFREVRDPDTMFHGQHHSNNFDIFVTPAFTHSPFQGGDPYARPQVHFGASASGMFRQFTFTGTSSYFLTDTIDAGKGRMRLVNGAYEYTDSSGAVYLFDPSVTVDGVLAGSYAPYSQRIASITYPDGRIRSFTYVSGKLKLVSDTSGYAAVFDYGSNGLISAACGFNLSQTYVTTGTTCAGAPLKVSYGYTTEPTTSKIYLSYFTDVLGQVTTYAAAGLTGNVLITCIKPPGYANCKISNAWGPGDNIVQTLADGSVWGASSGADIRGTDSDDPGVAEGGNVGSFSDPNGKVSSFIFTGTSPVAMTDPVGRTTTYQFGGGNTFENQAAGYPDVQVGSLLQSVTLPEGDQYLAEWNGPFGAVTKETWKAKPGSSQPDIVANYGYAHSGTAAQISHPISVQDGKGNQTDYTYGTHGGVLSEMKPAPSAGAARPLKLTSWVQKYAYIKNSGGTLVAATTPIWVIASETECQTAAGSNTAVCDSAKPQKVTTYEYGANGTADNLNVRGVVVTADGSSRRTCNSYDSYGNRISQTAARAGLSSCP